MLRYSPVASTNTRSTPTPRSANPFASVSITRSAPPPRIEPVNSATLPSRKWFVTDPVEESDRVCTATQRLVRYQAACEDEFALW